jgi:ABC-type dipeptide/oligopeptide/nickel transport system permease component
VLSFVLRRAAGGLLSVVGVSLLVFLFLHLVPGDPVDNLAGGEATPDQRREVMECMNLDKSMPKQFLLFLGNVANGTLGRQCPGGRDKPPVIERIKQVFPDTLELALASMLVAIALALPLGVLGAIKQGSLGDAAVTAVSVLGVSIPIPWMGPMLLSIFYLGLGILPGPAENDARFALVLPSICLGTHFMAMLARMTRSSLIDVLREDYMQTARAKGLGDAVVILKHGLRNALLPVITVAGMQFGSVLAGAIVTEQIFQRDGLGTLIYNAIRQRNYPVVQGCVLVIAVIYVTVNVLVDLAYGVADPRIRKA